MRNLSHYFTKIYHRFPNPQIEFKNSIGINDLIFKIRKKEITNRKLDFLK